MKRFVMILMGVNFCFQDAGFAQGTVNFANIGRGVDNPISGPDGLLTAGYFAQLQLEDGTNVGDPAPILANGLFSGGTRTVEGVLGGSVANLRVFFYNVGRRVAWATRPTSVTLAGPGQIPSVLIIDSEIAIPLVDCSEFEANTGEPCWWENDSLTMGPPVIPPKLPKTIGYRLLENGRLELKWPVGTALLRSRQPGGANRSSVSPTTAQDDLYVWTVATSSSQLFFWLE